jgi:hypothetical protein
MNSPYLAYLIRFECRENQSGWRASLENVHTRESLTFATEWELLIYLLQTLSEKSITPGGGAYTKKGENNESH